jgi:apolipoprotein D and lipocalin family protein
MKAVLVSLLLAAMPVGNATVPQPAKAVDTARYMGLWYEYARYENRFERNCDGVTAEYAVLPDGKISVLNSCRKGANLEKLNVAKGKAKPVGDAQKAKLKVSFFGPFYVGDYWVLDHADDYSWSIVGEPSGKYLWLLTRQAKPANGEAVVARAQALGYDTALLRKTRH